MMDLISTAFSAFEQRMQSEQDGIPMERIYLDDLLPGEDSMQRSDLIADPMRWNRKRLWGKRKTGKNYMKG